MRTTLAALLIALPLLAPTPAAARALPDCPWQLWLIYPFYCATGLDPWGIVTYDRM